MGMTFSGCCEEIEVVWHKEAQSHNNFNQFLGLPVQYFLSYIDIKVIIERSSLFPSHFPLFQIPNFPLNPLWAEKWNVACHISKQRMSQSSAIAAIRLRQRWAGEPWGKSGCENTGYWPQRAEVHIKGMISVSLDSCLFPYIEKC